MQEDSVKPGDSPGAGMVSALKEVCQRAKLHLPDSIALGVSIQHPNAESEVLMLGWTKKGCPVKNESVMCSVSSQEDVY